MEHQTIMERKNVICVAFCRVVTMKRKAQIAALMELYTEQACH